MWPVDNLHAGGVKQTVLWNQQNPGYRCWAASASMRLRRWSFSTNGDQWTTSSPCGPLCASDGAHDRGGDNTDSGASPSAGWLNQHVPPWVRGGRLPAGNNTGKGSTTMSYTPGLGPGLPIPFNSNPPAGPTWPQRARRYLPDGGSVVTATWNQAERRLVEPGDLQPGRYFQNRGPQPVAPMAT